MAYPEETFSYSDKTLKAFELARKEPSEFNLLAAKLSAAIDAFSGDEYDAARELTKMSAADFGERLAANDIPGMKSPAAEEATPPASAVASQDAPTAEPEGNIFMNTLAAIGGAILGTAHADTPKPGQNIVPMAGDTVDEVVTLATQDFGASNLDRARKLAAEYAKPPQVAAAPEPAPEAAEPTDLDLLIEKLEKPQPMLARSKHPKEENKPLQQALAMLGELKVGKDGKPDDGYFGKGTEAAVRRIQAEAQKDDPSIAVDGIVGKDTWGIILEKLKEKQAEQQPAIAGLGHFDSPSVPPMAQNEKAASRQA